jgi:gluconokinase
MGRVVVVMGVTGVGKTTVGRLVAAALGAPFLDADDFHDAPSIERMRAGEPLDGAGRRPWIDRVNHALRADHAGDDVVLACSALTPELRTRLARGLDDVVFVALTGDPALIRDRLAARRHHFAGANLLPSQLETLELPAGAIIIDVTPGPATVAARVVDALREAS